MKIDGMLIDGILKVVLFLWVIAFSFYGGYCLGISGCGKQFWEKFFNDEGEEDDETFEGHK